MYICCRKIFYMKVTIQDLDFTVSKKLISGLFFTNNKEHIVENMNCFAIEFEVNQAKNTVKSDVCKRENHAIITLQFKEDAMSQYLISNDLQIDKLSTLGEDVLPKPFKKLIKEAFEMTQKPKTLGDFFKK